MKENNDLLERYKEKWNRVKYFLSYYSDGYDDKCMKIRHNSDDDLLLEKPLKLSHVVILITSFYNDDKKYPHIILEDRFYKLSEKIYCCLLI